jgi:hypothetical protein
MPIAVKGLGCSWEGCEGKGKFLSTSGAVFGTRLCSIHYYQQLKESEFWLSGGPCVRCHRPRTWKRTRFTGRESTSTCAVCTARISPARRKGLPIPSVEEDAKNRMGCASCGLPEWATDKVWFTGLGEGRRCRPCSTGRTREFGGESVPWTERVGNNGCRNPACLLPEEKVGKDGRGGGIDRRCMRCYKYRKRCHGLEWSPKLKRKPRA